MQHVYEPVSVQPHCTAPAIVDEVRRLVDNGTREILLLGQNITAYGVAEARRAGVYKPAEFSALAELLTELNGIDGLARISSRISNCFGKSSSFFGTGKYRSAKNKKRL